MNNIRRPRMVSHCFSVGGKSRIQKLVFHWCNISQGVPTTWWLSLQILDNHGVLYTQGEIAPYLEKWFNQKPFESRKLLRKKKGQ